MISAVCLLGFACLFGDYLFGFVVLCVFWLVRGWVVLFGSWVYFVSFVYGLVCLILLPLVICLLVDLVVVLLIGVLSLLFGGCYSVWFCCFDCYCSVVCMITPLFVLLWCLFELVGFACCSFLALLIVCFDILGLVIGVLRLDLVNDVWWLHLRPQCLGSAFNFV